MQDYSASVLKKLKLLLSSSFEDAMDNGLCTRNPTNRIKLPHKTTVEKEVFNKTELKYIHKFAKADPFGHVVECMILAGLRSGEVRGLRWSDFDFDNEILRIDRAVKSDGELGLPKSGKTRVVPLNKKLAMLIKNLTRTGIYITLTNNYLTKDAFEYRYEMFMQRIAANHSVRPLTPHSCRHTYGTSLRAQGVDIRTVQLLMGHADIQTTVVYDHPDIEDLKNAVKHVK